MAIEFKIPDLGENISSADIGQILVKEGDTIVAGQNVLELETEKAVFEVECPHAGKVAKIHLKVGDSVSVGTLAMTIEGAAAGAIAAPKAAPAAEAAPHAPVKAAPVAPPPPPAPAPVAPAARTEVEVHNVAPVNAKPEPAAAVATLVEHAPATQTKNPEGWPAPAAPATRRLARELGVDLHEVKGTGPGARITQDDVRGFVKQRMTSPAPAAIGSAPATPTLPDFSEFGPVDRVKLNKLSMTAAANLSLAWQTIPHVTQHDLVDVTEVEAVRRRMVSDPRYKGPKITMTVIAVKACVAALKTFPHFNASFDAKSGEVLHKRYYNIGVAVDTENGLLVPIIKNADRKTIIEIAQEITDLSEKARARKLDMQSMRGGTFTISNLGGIGGTGFTPIVNWPEVAILGMSRSVEQPKLVNGNLENRLMLPLSLSYDHRVINGADAARFVKKLTELLADAFNLLIET